MSGEINEKQRDQIERVYSCGKHLLSLIDDVIDISKIEAGIVEVVSEEFLLDEVINEAAADVRQQLEGKGLSFEVDVPSGVWLHTDRRRLLQCILNYLSNAVKFTESGKVRLEARDAGREIEVSVSDTGIGIPTDDLPSLFMPFSRLEIRHKRATPGSGLGLYLTKKMVEGVLDGEVGVESEEGRGSIFRLRVPKELKGKA